MDLITVIAEMGFPIAVSIYLLTRIEVKLDGIANSITNLSKIIAERM